MADAVNEAEFQGERWTYNYRLAQGYIAGDKPEHGEDPRVGGIFSPQKMKLSVGDVIYRFGTRHKPVEAGKCGAWWMIESTIRLLADHASSASWMVANARYSMAVPPAFSTMDLVFVASVRQRIAAFAGAGSAIFREDLPAGMQIGAPPLLPAGIERDGSARSVSLSYQMFIPGMASVAANALGFEPVLPVEDWFARFRRTVPAL